ncbi:unnamed protein product [Rhizoctonia solani]|uniref:Plastocyanin-like domain-containing protein n=1 Tax=Rhizoctonia solani TaxID=456999 RepID=A0A8H3AV04_9AGAM|nr:unnamed protein product [Rhizoctonia solani]
MARTTFLASVSLFVSAVLARTVEYDFKITNGQVAPDGAKRDATLVNGQYPGPLIFANKGDTLKVKVRNELKNPEMYRTTSIVCLFDIYQYIRR